MSMQTQVSSCSITFRQKQTEATQVWNFAALFCKLFYYFPLHYFHVIQQTININRDK